MATQYELLAGGSMSQREDVAKFEQLRIKALQEERLHIQKKTFTKWMNSFLQKARMEVEDLFTDLADGKKLLKLLEIISGEKLGKPNNGKMRVHKVENVNKSLAFLSTKVRLESIGAEDIVDGNPRLILGLIWTIILRFQIQEIEIDVDEENESSEKKSAKDALLLWCQRKTNGYSGVQIHDFTGSWRSGLGFNALIHAHRPDLIDFPALQPTRHIDNLNNAFDTAATHLGIPSLLDAEDVDTSRPDEKSIITYVASYYHTFARLKNEMKSGRRIANIVGQMMDADKMKIHYERLTSDLLQWIRMKISELEDRNFPNSLEGIQKELLSFKQYRTVEKPPKYKERSEIEALYFHINTQLKSLNQPAFTPQEGQLIHDLEKGWEQLERAEHRREVALRQELLRQERLEQLNYKFERKSVLREGYLKEMIQVLSDPRYGSNLTQVDATVKKHEAISADIMAREERFHDLSNMSAELVREKYHGSERVQQRETEVLERWRELLALLEKHKENLSLLCGLMAILREMDTVMTAIKDLQDNFQSQDVGPHLLAVEDLLQKHSLMELQVTAIGETQRRLGRQGHQYMSSGHREAATLQQRLDGLNEAYDNLLECSKQRRARLEEARNFFQFIQDHEDEEGWIVDKQRICKTGISAKDLRAVLSLQQKHKVLQDEMSMRRPKSEQVCEAGRALITDKHPKSHEINTRISGLQEQWSTLNELVALRRKQLEDAAEAYQFYTDANEAESWLNEKMAIVASTDYGEDEPSAQALLQRHRDLQGELNAYSGDIQSLNSQAEKLVKAGISTLELSAEPEPLSEADGGDEEEWVNEMRLVPQEVWEEEPVERTEYRTVTEERLVPQVKSQYPFNGQGMVMEKGEVMYLLNKTNDDWWNVRKTNGQDGFVPANYVREIEPKTVQVQVRRPEKIKEVKRIRKTKMVKQVIPVRKQKAPKPPGRTSRRKSTDDENQNVEKRQQKINHTYKQLQDMAVRRHALLEDSIHLFGFYRECDDFEKWIKDKEKMLRADDSTDTVETAKRKYEKFLTDLSASGKRVEAIDAAVEEFVRQGHSQLDKVKARQNQIHQLWDHLNWLKGQKERSLEGASSVELFHRTCDEARDWMQEKMTQLDTAELGPDLKTVQALQRRHLHLERELAPVQEKVNRVNLLANSVKSSYPNEKGNVNARQKEVQELWEKVKTKAIERRSRLEDAVGQQIFMNSSKNLLSWVHSVKDALNADETARDLATAESLLKKHSELGDDIRTHEDEFHEVSDLGKQLLQRNPNLTEVQTRIVKLAEEQEAVARGWQEKGSWLDQCRDLQIFNKEADAIDTTTSSHEAFLEFTDLGGSLDDVEALLKRHEDFENMLNAQDERSKIFSEMADKLIAAGHYDSKGIDDRRMQILARRKAVKESAKIRRAALLASHNFQEFVANSDDLRGWLGDKLRTAGDESYRDLSNIERKLQKHEAFERELRSNGGQLRNVNKMGQALISEGNYRSPEVQKILDNLNTAWEELVQVSRNKGARLRQAAAQKSYNRMLEDAQIKLEEMEMALQSKQLGVDLRNCKQLIKKHQGLESDMNQWDQRVNDLVNNGEEMAHEGHFDAENILKASKDCQQKFASLKVPAQARREALDESLRFHKFGFELATELGWIREHMPLAASDTLGSNLHQAQSMYKKHKKLESEITGHQPMIDRTLASGQNLVSEGHPEVKQIDNLCQQLIDSWKELNDKAAERAKKLELSLKAQQFFFEAGEVESWLTERNDVLSSTDYGRDRDAATKLLTKHKTLELELDSYSGIVSEMGHTANAMVNAKHPDAKAIASKQQLLSQQMRTLQKLATARQQRLMESMYRHEYFLESAELEQWIREQSQVAASEDYGQDYEHLQILQNKFDELKRSVEAGSERFNQCEELAKKLIANESPYIPDIEKRQVQLSADGIERLDNENPVRQVAERHAANKEAWQQLLNQMSHRERRLSAAGEIHRFHRDVAEALARINEKMAALPDDRGRDLNSVLALIRRHEGFENDLVALEAQLQVLVEDAARLQALYPGNNATQIAQQQTVVLSSWTALQNRSAQRREELQASCDLQRFLTQVRDLFSWASGLRAAMLTEEKVRDAAGAQTLKAEHEAVKAEIEAREDNFKTVLELGEAMIQGQHYASQEIRERSDQLLEERQKLHAAWQHKKVHLDQLIDLHFFLRDAKQIDTISGSQEVALAGSNFGHSVDEVTAAMKKHDAFEKLLGTQEEKVLALQEHGDKLLAQRHFESQSIAQRLAQVVERRVKVKDLCATRRGHLEDALLHAQFIRDVGEAELWIDEKQKKLEAEAGKGEGNSLEEKIKKLQKHQAFQAELSANQGRIGEIQEKGEMLLRKKHKSSREVRQQLDQLLSSWRTLLQESSNHGRGLEEAQDILEFNNQLEKIEAWIRDKEMMVQAADTGRDYEHCLALQRKLDDVDSDMRVDDSRMRAINALADKLIRQGRSDTRSVDQRRDQFNSKLKSLQGALGEYRERLAGALEVHLFNRDVDDTAQRVAEKAVAMSSEDTGRDLMGVEQLQRKQDALERDMTAIEGKLKEHESEAKRLSQKYPDMAVPIFNKLSALTDDWRNLLQLSRKRRDALSAAYTLHKFKSDLKELDIWVGEAIKRMGSSELPSSVPEAEAMLQLHQERKAEIDGRQEAFKSLKEFGLRIPEAENDMSKLEELRRTLGAAWEDRKQRLTQAHQLQLFREQTDQAHSWLAGKEAFLNNDDVGDSLSSVEALLRKHEDFEKTLVAQLSRVEELEKFALEILSDHHYDSNAITQKLKSVISRRDRLKEATAARRKRLQESRQLHQFLRNMYEVDAWLTQKLQVASDESYRDPTNLQSKIQRHAAFESELTANRARVNGVTAEGEGLIGAGHFASMEIRMRLDELETEWRRLQDASLLKRERLNDAYQALLFSRTLEEMETWMDDVESQLASEDHGKDLSSVQNLLKRHTLLESDVLGHAETCEQIKDTAGTFERSNHFMKEEIQDRAANVIKRYRSLHEPMQIRRENLEDALLLKQLIRDIDDEMQWLAEKEPQAASDDLGSSLTAVQSLQKKHQALEAEILSHEPVVSNLSKRAHQMVQSNHFAAQRIEKLSSELQEKLGTLKDISSVRRLRLLDAVESQMFYAEAAEAETWMKEKRPMLTSSDVGKDEDSVLSLLKKLESCERDLSAFQHTIGRLAKLSSGLVDRGHFDSENIKQKQVDLENHFAQLQVLHKKREERLIESRKLFRFLREAEEVAEWIGDQTTVAASEDYGRDVEHVELLIQTFETFLSGLSASEGRVSACLSSGKALIAEKNPESGRIQSKLDETQQLWEDLKELAHARQEALAGAKQVHVFDRTADETISWIQEKDATLISEGYGQDLETIQTLVRKHQGFETDLGAVKEQVESVGEEAGRLAELFPDAREHIEVKHEEAMECWNELLEKAAQRKDKLHQAEQLQAYFDQYRDLMSWINEMIAKVTAPDLAQDVPGAEALITRHSEHKAEIDTRSEAFDKFYTTGKQLIDQGHFLSDEIEDKISVLKQRRKVLNDTWYLRQTIYAQNLDTQMFKRDADQLENWLQSREATLHDPKLGESILQVEELIRKHEDFEKTIEAQEEKFNALNRVTLLEEAFRKQQQAEEAARLAERERVEKERVEARKRKEVQRITDERRREDERRRVPEVRLGRDEVNGDRHDSSGSLEVIPSGSSVFNEDETSMERALPLTKSNSVSAVDTTRLHPDSTDTGVQKSSSISQMFRKATGDVKRAESMRVELKKPKRTPSFTTRRRTQSFRKLQKLEQQVELPPVEIQGILDRKHELQGGGKKAAVRSWKSYYTVLCGQLLCFFKDHDDFVDSKAATSPIIIFKAQCEKADNYTKKKHVFRLCGTDGSKFLFLAPTEAEMEDWVNKITFHAQLPPSLQLLSYDESQKQSQNTLERTPTVSSNVDVSSGSSPGSSPETSPRRPNTLPSNSLPRNSSGVSQAQLLQQHRMNNNLPPQVVPRAAPPPIPLRSPTTEVTTDNMRGRPHEGELMRPPSFNAQSRGSTLPTQRPLIQNANYTNGDSTWRHQSSQELTSPMQEAPPPLPSSAPPNRPPMGGLPVVPQLHHRDSWDTSMAQQPIYRNFGTAGKQAQTREAVVVSVGSTSRPNSLPPYVAPPPAGSMPYHQNDRTNSGIGVQRRPSESSSESEQHSNKGSRSPSNAKGKDKRSSVFNNLFGRKQR
ncbi:spectrin beta chain, non-erythrocytic 1 isoform X4 [Frankliniella occidentalis]|uniref:Spectrin beta chain, non-erythrocytic 1 isoform X4 n=1 Tax=Frankliniella occidentalis TaxID=133901 RepID=A0A9C6U3P4_FRAOC|nr:spectrin beta chain, non-erythrocytic 1 isoform X4 [Frankliniella occidentalis]